MCKKQAHLIINLGHIILDIYDWTLCDLSLFVIGMAIIISGL